MARERVTEIVAEMVANVHDRDGGRGRLVETGDTVVVLESMKMEIPVMAERPPAPVRAMRVAPRDVVQEGDVLRGDSPPR